MSREETKSKIETETERDTEKEKDTVMEAGEGTETEKQTYTDKDKETETVDVYTYAQAEKETHLYKMKTPFSTDFVFNTSRKTKSKLWKSIGVEDSIRNILTPRSLDQCMKFLYNYCRRTRENRWK